MRGIRDPVVRFGVLHVVDAGVLADLDLTVAVRAVGAQQHLLVGADDAGQHALHTEGAGALHQHGGVLGGVAVGEFKQVGADLLGDGLVVVVPGAVVEEHLLLDRAGGGQRAGGQQLVVAVHDGACAFLYGSVVAVCRCEVVCMHESEDSCGIGHMVAMPT